MQTSFQNAEIDSKRQIKNLSDWGYRETSRYEKQ